ncbi:MAG: S9 family peptidase [Pseudobacteriovorax sp.]|nr:S9 family peptidase [Pseudobacteriovorax sp.]
MKFTLISMSLWLMLPILTPLGMADWRDNATLLQPEQVFELEQASDIALSPNSKHIAYARSRMDKNLDKKVSSIWLINTKTGESLPVTDGLTTSKGPVWSPDGKRILYVSAHKKQQVLFVYWLQSGKISRLAEVRGDARSFSWSPNGRQIVFIQNVKNQSKPLIKGLRIKRQEAWAKDPLVIQHDHYRSDGKGYLPDASPQMFLLSSQGGTPRQLTKGNHRIHPKLSWLGDQRILFSGLLEPDWVRKPLHSNIYQIDTKTERIQPLVVSPDTHRYVTADPKYKTIASLGFAPPTKARQYQRIYLSKADGTGMRLLLDIDRNISDIQWANRGRSLYFRYESDGVEKIGMTNLKGKWKDMGLSLGGLAIGRPYSSGQFSVSDNGAIAFTKGGTQDLSNVGYKASARSKIKQFTDLNQDVLGSVNLARVEGFTTSKTPGKETIHAWYLRPESASPEKPCPLIMEIHGGPFASYGPNFAAELQLFASAGYCVVYANPRGSTGYGDEFAQKISHNYPSEDYDDLMAVVDHMSQLPFVDGNNLFVTGGSGGGVLTSWIIGKTNRFRAAVVSKPVINWFSFVLTADRFHFFAQNWFQKMPWDDPMTYYKQSPISLVGQVQTPTMLLTGEKDYRTPMSETEQYYQALKLRGVESAMVRFPDAAHGIASRPSQLALKSLYILGWFDKFRSQ